MSELDGLEEKVVSAARAARKEAQALVAEAKNLLSELEEHLSGRSGLDAEAKAAVLNTANTAATAVVEKVGAVKDAVTKAVNSL